MPNPNDPGTPAPRTAEVIEAELAAIDVAAREVALTDDDVADTTVKPTPAPKPEAPHDYEYEARRKGWRPQAEYTGPEGKWVDAQTFVERGERFTRKLEGTIASLQAKVDSFEGTKAQFRKFFEEQMAKRDREHAEAIANLRIQRSAAIREGDDALAIDLEDRIDATKAQQAAFKKEAEAMDAPAAAPAATPATDEAPNPVLLDWIEDGNAWFKEDEVLTQHAIKVGKAIRAAGDKSGDRVFLDKVKAQVMEDFPRRFNQKPAGPKPNASEGGAQGGTSGAAKSGYNGKTERDLPQADLVLMRQFVKDGLYTKEQFLKSYFSRNG